MNQLYMESVPGSEVEEVVGKIEEAVKGESIHTILMACLSIVIFLQHPDISNEKLRDGVKGASEWIAMFISGVDEEIDPKQVN